MFCLSIDMWFFFSETTSLISCALSCAISFTSSATTLTFLVKSLATLLIALLTISTEPSVFCISIVNFVATAVTTANQSCFLLYEHSWLSTKYYTNTFKLMESWSCYWLWDMVIQYWMSISYPYLHKHIYILHTCCHLKINPVFCTSWPSMTSVQNLETASEYWELMLISSHVHIYYYQNNFTLRMLLC